MKKALTLMAVGAVSAIAVEKYNENSRKINKIARRTFRMFRK